MKRRQYISAGIMMIVVMLCLSACSSGPHTETFVISGGTDVSSTEQSSRPVQIRKIYRLPGELANTQLLGWSSSDSIILSGKEISSGDYGSVARMVRPYEESRPISGIAYINSQSILSPDGKYISEASSTATKNRIKIFTLQDGKEKEIISLPATRNYIQDSSWSNNSLYFVYLVESAEDSHSNYLYIYNLKAQTSKKYKLTGIKQEDTLFSAKISNDGQSVLLQTFSHQRPKTSMHMGRISGDHIEFQYERLVGSGDQMAWLSDDQVVFLGIDGTLYEYDQRNGELSVLLEKVLNFTFSPDRKNIAYTTYDEQTVIYAGKLQGRNILYKEPVYRGILSHDMRWSLDNKNLLIQGQKPYDPSQVTSEVTAQEAFVIELE